VIEGDGVIASRYQPLVDDVEHFQERHIRTDVWRIVFNEPSSFRGAGLPPYPQAQSHHL
jgi:hypothetical protein